MRKLHTYSGEPFCYAEIYVPTPVFDSLPRDIGDIVRIPAKMTAHSG